MIAPQRAPVRPRAISPIPGQALLLEALAADPAHLARRRPIQILGGPGSGKTTALRHLRAVLPDLLPTHPATDFDFLDEPELEELVYHQAQKHVVVLATKKPWSGRTTDWLTLQLAAWDEDDFLEYLLARHKTQCGAVLTALRHNGDAWQLEGIAELCAFTLDYLAAHPSGLPALTALRSAFLEQLATPDLIRAARAYCLGQVLGDDTLAAQSWQTLSGAAPGIALLRLLRHAPLRRVLAADHMAGDLAAGKECLYLQTPPPRPGIPE